MIPAWLFGPMPTVPTVEAGPSALLHWSEEVLSIMVKRERVCVIVNGIMLGWHVGRFVLDPQLRVFTIVMLSISGCAVVLTVKLRHQRRQFEERMILIRDFIQ